MKKMLRLLLCSCLFLFLLSACGESEQPTEDIDEPTIQQDDETELSEVNETEDSADYTDLENIFSEVIPGAEVSVQNLQTRIMVYIRSDLSKDSQPENWEEIIAALNSALAKSQELATNYSTSTICAQIESPDESILASGYNGSIKFDLFKPIDSGTETNPPTISQFEYDQIAVGMTLTEVREIIGSDGVLQSEVGDAGSSVGTIKTYRWEGTGGTLSYATILFDDYIVYSKHGYGLE